MAKKSEKKARLVTDTGSTYSQEFWKGMSQIEPSTYSQEFWKGMSQIALGRH